MTTTSFPGWLSLPAAAQKYRVRDLLTNLEPRPLSTADEAAVAEVLAAARSRLSWWQFGRPSRTSGPDEARTTRKAGWG